MAEPWERQRHESHQAFQAFAAYRDMGTDRSTAKVAQRLGKSKTLMDRWSSRWAWVSRAQAWDAELDRQNRQAQEQARRDMAERHAKEAMLLQQKILARLERLKPEELSPADLARWLDVAVKVERLSRGEPAEVVKSQVDGQVRTNGDLFSRIAAYTAIFAAAGDSPAEGSADGDGAGEPVYPARPDPEAG